VEKEIAKKLMELFLSLEKPLNKATDLTSKINDVIEKKAVRKVIGEITGRIYTDFMMPVIKQYPDLDPDKNEIE